MSHQSTVSGLYLVVVAAFSSWAPAADEPSYARLPLYRPTLKHTAAYAYHPARRPPLMYNHDADIELFRGRFLVAWNANAKPAEGVPGQYNFLTTSTDFAVWTDPVRLFYAEGGCENPVPTDNQWQPIFINYRDERMFCAWCDFNARRTFVAHSGDGLKWRNEEVPTAPQSLAGKVVGFPTNHGLLTSKDVLMFPCSLPPVGATCGVRGTLYAGVLLSHDQGKTWQWSEPIRAARWSEVGEQPAEYGTDDVSLWEPMLFEEADGRIGLLIRNSTAQDKPEIPEKTYRMLWYASSGDHGRTWSKARPVDVDTICSRCYAAAGVGGRDGMIMVMNDNHVRIPKPIPHDRYFLSLYCAPVTDPDLLLPGPLVQPEGGTAYYPNGFVRGDTLYLAYSYPRGIFATQVSPLPDYSRPFLLPRGGRSGLAIEGRQANLSHRTASLGLVLTEALTKQAELQLGFRLNVARYDGQPYTLLSLGGRTGRGTIVRAAYNAEAAADLIEVRLPGNRWTEVGRLQMGRPFDVRLVLGDRWYSIAVDGGQPRRFDQTIARKICFGGLYVPPTWPMGTERPSEVRLDLDSITVR